MTKLEKIIDAHKGKISVEAVVRCGSCATSQPLAVDNADKAVSIAFYMLWGYDPLREEWLCPNCRKPDTPSDDSE